MPDLDDTAPKEEVDRMLRKELAEFGLLELKKTYADQLRTMPVLQNMARKWEHNAPVDDEIEIAADSKTIYLDILNKQRQWLLKKNKADQMLDEEIVRKHLQLLDLEEEKLRYL